MKFLMPENLIPFSVATFLLALSPGSDNIFVLTQSIANGKRTGLAIVFGLISGCLVHTTLLAFGVSSIIKQSDSLYLILKVFGALYLFYLAFKVYQSSSTIKLSNTNKTPKSYLQLFQQGFIMNVLNPKVTLFFLAFFPGFLFSSNLSTVTQFYLLGFLFMLISFLVFSAIAFAAGSIADKINQNPNAGLYLKWLQIFVFIGIGFFILV